MNRPAPRIRVAEIAARLILDPNGAHEIEVAAPHNIVSMRFSRDQVAELKRAIRHFEERVCVEDGRSGPDLTVRKSISLGGW